MKNIVIKSPIKTIIAMLLLVAVAVVAQQKTTLQHKSITVADDAFIVYKGTLNVELGFGHSPSALASLVSFQVPAGSTNANKYLLKFTMNADVSSNVDQFGFAFTGQSFSDDASLARLRLISLLDSQQAGFGVGSPDYGQAVMTVASASVAFGGLSSSVAPAGTVHVVNSVTSTGDMLLRDRLNDWTHSSQTLQWNSNRPKLSHLTGPGQSTAIFKDYDTGDNFWFHITDTPADGKFFAAYLNTTSKVMYIQIASKNPVGTATAEEQVKTFVINHPDKDQHYLVHSGIEGPNSEVFYNGTSQLNKGQVSITLPSYFEALTHKEGRTARLTAIDGFDGLSVKTQDGLTVKDGNLLVYSDNLNSNQRFNWEVKAIRKDIPLLIPEVEKKGSRVGGLGPYLYLER